jgi:hypothetical protein
MEHYLPEVTPLLIGIFGFSIGLVFALRERSWRKSARDPETRRHDAAA